MLITPLQAGQAVVKGVDVYLFLSGMMILSELAREAGVFDWIASLAATHARGSRVRLFVLIYLAGTAVTVFLSNDATAVVLTPAVLAIVRRLEVSPPPYLLACALIANAASFVLPISNPANLVIFDSHMPPLLQWLKFFALPSFAAVVTTFFILRFVCRKSLEQPIETNVPKTKLSLDGRLALGGLIAAAVALLTASALKWNLGAPTCAAAVVVAAIMSMRDKRMPARIVKGVSWSVLPLVAGLFVIVEALQTAGALHLVDSGLQTATAMNPPLGKLAAGFGVGFISNVMNNLPVGLISGAAMQASQIHGPVANALLIGVDLGPNLSVTGSLATILWLIVLRREKVEMTGWEFFKVGMCVMPVSLLASLLALGN
jgi:arsenical pump membrane protein